MKTIDDILCEMRKDIPRVVDTKVILRNYADRIEAAWERKAKEIATENAVLPAVCITKPSGNAAKMREALEKIDRIVWDKHRHTKEETEAHRLATEALSAPARNCDVYTKEQLCEIVTTEAQSELSGDTPQGIRDIVDIVAKGVIKSLFAEAKAKGE